MTNEFVGQRHDLAPVLIDEIARPCNAPRVAAFPAFGILMDPPVDFSCRCLPLPSSLKAPYVNKLPGFPPTRGARFRWLARCREPLNCDLSAGCRTHPLALTESKP